MRNEYRGRTAKFTRNGHTYYATLEVEDINKNIYGDKESDGAGKDAKVKTGADGNFFELVENSEYFFSQEERGKDSRAHRNNIYWDYYIKTVQIDSKVFELLANVRKTLNGEYVYSIELYENKKIEAASPSDTSQKTGVFLRVPTTSKFNLSQSGTESQAQNSAAMPASALETDEAYLSVAEKYRDGTATEAETEQLRQAVEAAAKKAGYSQRAFHGTENNSGFTTFIGDVYLAVNKDVAETYSGNDGNIYELFVNQKNFFVVEQSDGKSNRRTQGTVLCVLVPL